MSQSSKYAQIALWLSREADVKDATITSLKQDIETLESTIQAQQIIIENLKKPGIVYFPDMGDK